MNKNRENNNPLPSEISAEQRLIESLRLYFLARELKAASLREFKPYLNEDEIKLKVKEFFLYGNS